MTRGGGAQRRALTTPSTAQDLDAWWPRRDTLAAIAWAGRAPSTNQTTPGVSDPRSSPGAKSGTARRGSLTPNPPLLNLGAGPSCGAERRPSNSRRGNTGPGTFVPALALPSAGASGRVHAGSRSCAAARRTRRGPVHAPARRARRVRWQRTPRGRHPPASADEAVNRGRRNAERAACSRSGSTTGMASPSERECSKSHSSSVRVSGGERPCQRLVGRALERVHAPHQRPREEHADGPEGSAWSSSGGAAGTGGSPPVHGLRTG